MVVLTLAAPFCYSNPYTVMPYSTEVPQINLLHKDRQGRRGGWVMLYVKENPECTEFIYSDRGSRIKCLWVKIRGVVSKWDLTVGICYWPPDKDDKANKATFGPLEQASGQHNLVLTRDFDYPVICSKNNTAVHTSSVKFLE